MSKFQVGDRVILRNDKMRRVRTVVQADDCFSTGTPCCIKFEGSIALHAPDELERAEEPTPKFKAGDTVRWRDRSEVFTVSRVDALGQLHLEGFWGGRNPDQYELIQWPEPRLTKKFLDEVEIGDRILFAQEYSSPFEEPVWVPAVVKLTRTYGQDHPMVTIVGLTEDGKTVAERGNPDMLVNLA